MGENRHTCIICKRKRYELKMKKVFLSSWACSDPFYSQNCSNHPEIKQANIILQQLKGFKHITLKHFSK